MLVNGIQQAREARQKSVFPMGERIQPKQANEDVKEGRYVHGGSSG